MHEDFSKEAGGGANTVLLYYSREMECWKFNETALLKILLRFLLRFLRSYSKLRSDM